MKKLLFVLLMIAILSTVIVLFWPEQTAHDDIWGDSYDVAIFFSVPLIYTEITIYSTLVYFFTSKNKRAVKTTLHILTPLLSAVLLIALIVPFPTLSNKPANILFFCSLFILIITQSIGFCIYLKDRKKGRQNGIR